MVLNIIIYITIYGKYCYCVFLMQITNPICAQFWYKVFICVARFVQKHKDESNTTDGAITVGLMLSLRQISASSEESDDDTGQPTR